jgi:hypothetical protein
MLEDEVKPPLLAAASFGEMALARLGFHFPPPVVRLAPFAAWTRLIGATRFVAKSSNMPPKIAVLGRLANEDLDGPGPHHPKSGTSPGPSIFPPRE